MAVDVKDLQLADGAQLKDYVIGQVKTQTGARYGTGLNTVAIVGFAPSSLKIALDGVFRNEQWSPANKHYVWGLNELYMVTNPEPPVNGDDAINKHWDEWFDIHDPRSSVSTRDVRNYEWLAAQTKPIWMVQHFADVPASREYPLKEIIRYFESDYLTNTITMMILLAAMRGRQQEDAYVDGQLIKKGTVIDPDTAFGEIHIYGVDMAQDQEYSHQRPSCEAAIGFARGLGIKVYVPPTSDLMKVPFIYGYEGDGQHLRAKMDARIQELKAQADQHRAIGNNAKLNLGAMVAVCNEFAAVINKAESEGQGDDPYVKMLKDRHAELQPEIAKANQAAEANLMRAAMLDGAHDDASYWRRAHTGA